MQIPDIREGDQLNPGMPVADVLDLSELEVLARVGELDRANLREGQDVDHPAGRDSRTRRFNGKIKSMSGTATANVFSSDPAKKFDVVFSIDMKQLFTTLGVKPEQIQQILATAEQNRRKPAPAISLARRMMMAGGASRSAGAPSESAASRCAPSGRRSQAAGATPASSPNARTSAGRLQQRSGGPRPPGIRMADADDGYGRRRSSSPRRTWPTPSCLRLPKRTRSSTCCCGPACWPTSRSSSRRSRTRSHIPDPGGLREGRQAGRLRARTASASKSAPFKPLKRSESTMVVAERSASPARSWRWPIRPPSKDDKKKGDKSANGGAMGALPGGGGK